MSKTDNSIENNGLLRFLTCGSVDDGKSTLIGRLLYDSKTIFNDTLGSIERSSKRRGMDEIDLSLLTDGLEDEREQGITIDVAYRYFSSTKRKYIVADAPGHEQYTRNMVTAASSANLAIILLDARKGVLTQTRRHSYIAHLLGIKHLLVAVNKMDLVNWSEERFAEICTEYLNFANKLGISDVKFIPMSALKGDMVVDRGENLNWYKGESLFDLLQNAPLSHSETKEDFRFPVQYICRPRSAEYPDYRAYMGRIESGEISIGDEICVLPSNLNARIKDIQIAGHSIEFASAEQSVSILLDVDLDISRGDMLVKVEQKPKVTKQIDAMLCWLSESKLEQNRRYIIQHTTRESKAKLESINYKIDINNLTQEKTESLEVNDIAHVSFKLAQPICVDSYKNNRSTGAFIIIDESNNNTIAAGMII